MKKDSKQRLFEVMGRLDSTFKPKLNENFGDEEFDANQEPSYGFNPEEHPPISDEPETDQNNIVDIDKNTLSEDSPFPVQGNNKYIDNHERYGVQAAIGDIEKIIEYYKWLHENDDYDTGKYDRAAQNLESANLELGY